MVSPITQVCLLVEAGMIVAVKKFSRSDSMCVIEKVELWPRDTPVLSNRRFTISLLKKKAVLIRPSYRSKFFVLVLIEEKRYIFLPSVEVIGGRVIM